MDTEEGGEGEEGKERIRRKKSKRESFLLAVGIKRQFEGKCLVSK